MCMWNACLEEMYTCVVHIRMYMYLTCARVVFLVHVALASVLGQEVDEETLRLSEHPDIDIRGKVSVVMSGYVQ